ncbi:MAG TPA: GNAT family N-acetyltransferase [Pelolinea sp.]|nr:GNAT family N-acetyltransferase [Pelolinea sp.]
MAIAIRTMRINDYTGALKLWQSLPGIGLSGADKKEQIQVFLEKNPGNCFVAVEKNEIIGTILGGSDGRRGYLYHLAVNQQQQKQGLGKKLVEECLASLKVLGIQKCHIFVISDNLEGMDFWEKVGWVKRDDILIMSKDL